MSMTVTLASKLTLSDDLSPDSRDREYKGRIKQVFSKYGEKLGKTVGINALGLVFFLPLLALFIVVLPYIIEPKILSQYTIIGDLGMGYGATSSQEISNLLNEIYTQRQLYSLLTLPALMIASIGMAGVYNCMRNILWGVECKVFKHFFLGIKRHWYKFLIAYTILGLFADGILYSLLEVLKYKAMGATIPALWLTLLIILCILGMILIMYYLILVPMFVTYKYSDKPFKNLGICMKNSAILLAINFVQVFFMAVIFIAPMLLCLIKVISIFVAIAVAIFGFAFYAILNIQYGQFISDTFIAYLNSKAKQETQKAKEKEIKEYREKREKERKKNSKRKR